jgi:hypothetical protein
VIQVPTLTTLEFSSRKEPTAEWKKRKQLFDCISWVMITLILIGLILSWEYVTALMLPMVALDTLKGFYGPEAIYRKHMRAEMRPFKFSQVSFQMLQNGVSTNIETGFLWVYNGKLRFESPSYSFLLANLPEFVTKGRELKAEITFEAEAGREIQIRLNSQSSDAETPLGILEIWRKKDVSDPISTIPSLDLQFRKPTVGLLRYRLAGTVLGGLAVAALPFLITTRSGEYGLFRWIMVVFGIGIWIGFFCLIPAVLRHWKKQRDLWNLVNKTSEPANS